MGQVPALAVSEASQAATLALESVGWPACALPAAMARRRGRAFVRLVVILLTLSSSSAEESGMSSMAGLHVRRGECPPSFALTLSFDGFDQIMGCRAEICRFAFGFFFVQSRRRSSKKGPQRTCNVSSSKKHGRCRKNRESTQSFIGNSNYSIGGPIMIHGRAPVPTPIPRRRDPRGSRHDPPARPHRA